MSDKIERLNQAIRRFYEQKELSTDLVESILYSVDAGGKRIRPLIMLEVLEGFGHRLTDRDYDAAASVEMIHTGSLIHDDLPAMDNDDYRRGRLTNHKQFDEATAILAGDSLFLDPFGLIAETDYPAEVKVGLIRELSYGSGTFGMVGGQMLDIKGEGRQVDLTELAQIHAHKTGKLLAFPFVAAGIVLQLSDEAVARLREAGEAVGLAFQVRDDILDVTASFEELGKTPQKDLLAEKSTYPSLLGLEQSYAVLDKALDQASAIFKDFEETNSFQGEKVYDMIERLRLNA
ncbi:polyprenyl synthetase family protein [Streptococcus caprae]|uniref:Polyprenyl synthetase family protein n=1 Tax=Streptococcus caprae TaxID=1640501 RepID=A0ABV8CU30_9STRE